MPDQILLPETRFSRVVASWIGLVHSEISWDCLGKIKSRPLPRRLRPFTLLHRLRSPFTPLTLLSLFIDFVDILSIHSSVIDAEIERDLR